MYQNWGIKARTESRTSAFITQKPVSHRTTA